ncbi:GFA family protein [Sphingosinicella sp. CPCC 101087]|uniref:GFA family protein n=1 Tax=Sphingosinicella sp. CPCC 101087 TaxID=2497754 RepID=UPI00101E15AE|nr:GFA family protein [Sphingosinicella sp. CPCC 101087]
MTARTYRGSCHCGAIAYEVEIDLDAGTGKCNCTFCMKARAWKAFVAPTAFRLSSGAGDMAAYRKQPQAPLKHFCPACGVYTHETGSADYMGGDFVGVFLSSLDDVEPSALASAPVRYSDGRNDNWQNPPGETRYL